MPLLSRAWQILLKGMEEAAAAPNAVAAAEMVLIRLAYTADLPPPDEILKALGGSTTVRTQPVARAPVSAAGPAMGGTPVPPRADIPQAPSPVIEHVEHAETPPDDIESDEDPALDFDDAPLPVVRSFAELVELAGARREAKLRYDLEERVSLVKFDPAGSIDLHLLPGAPKELPNELREKLNLWTGMRWIVALSNAPGERPLGDLQRERDAAEVREIKSHPAIAAVLQQFPDAKVKLNPLPGAKPAKG